MHKHPNHISLVAIKGKRIKNSEKIEQTDLYEDDSYDLQEGDESYLSGMITYY